MPLADLAVPFAESRLFLLPQPVTIALGRIFDMDPYVRERWRRHRHHGHGGLVGGVILAGIGVLLLLQNLGIPYFEDLERYWPVILIVVGIAAAARSIGLGGRVWGGAVCLAGTVFLLNNFGVIRGDIWRFAWPGILILIGLAMLAKAIDRQSGAGYDPVARAEYARKLGENIKDRIASGIGSYGAASTPNQLNAWAIFSGVRRRIDSQDFQGGEAFAMFGGVELDLRKAGSTRDEIVVELNALFGGIELRVPETWNVTVRGAGIFGGYEDETMDSRVAPGSKQPHLIVNGFAVFGGVSVKN
jgi:predicted membrane protein